MCVRESSVRFDTIIIDLRYAFEDLVQDKLIGVHRLEPAGLTRLRARIHAVRMAVDVVEEAARRLNVEPIQAGA